MEDRQLAEERFLTEEKESKPNRRSARAMLYATFAILANWIMNEMGVFRVSDMLMREGSLISIVILLIPQIIVSNEKIAQKRSTKYIMLGCALIATLAANVLMSFHATLSLILPMLLAMQYKSEKVGWEAFAGSALCAFFAPVISYLIGAWDTPFLQVLLQLCGIESGAAGEAIFTRTASVGQIVLYISLPHELMIIVTGLVMLIVIRNGQKSLENQLEIRRGNDKLLRMQAGIIDGMATIIESRDGGTGEHVSNTRHYVSVILDYMLEHRIHPETVTPEYVELVTGASILHDIGKVSIPDAILNKPGRFTPEEFEVMKTHALRGNEMVDRVFGDSVEPQLIRILHGVVGCHHEKWDGRGYPCGLRGEEIPLEGRIMAIADVFDALISERIYKKPYSVDEAYRILEEEAGTHFDRELVEIFIAVRPEIERFAAEHR